MQSELKPGLLLNMYLRVTVNYSHLKFQIAAVTLQQKAENSRRPAIPMRARRNRTANTRFTLQRVR